ncbi:MAG: TolC family protein [Thermoanaerobaculia bacterium]
MFLRLLAATAALLTVGSASAQPITESDAVSRALARQPFANLQQSAREASRASTLSAALWSNPSISYLEEPGGVDHETALTMTQRIELAGRGLRINAAKTRERAVDLDLASARLDVARATRLAFHELVAAERGVAVAGAWRATIEKASATVAALQRGGEVSGYDRRRAERELLSIDARLRTARARLAGARERLAAILGVEASALSVAGELLPAEPVDAGVLLAAIPSRPDIRAAALRAEAAMLQKRAAGRWWIPAAEITAGQKTLADDTDGTVFGAALSFPLFDRRQTEALVSISEERSARARHGLLLATASGEVRALAAEAHELRASAVAFRENAIASSEGLLQIADVAYRAGEIGILELLDASRAAIDADTEVIDLELRARIAAIELRHAAGADAGETNVTENAR